jgi:Predicted ATP-binding protein involved in virulence
MRSFKILGVRPLTGCNKHVLKNLKEEVYYPFYQNYDFKDGVVTKSKTSTVPENFYGTNISVHAIVGINGSGKSTVIELMIRIINNLSYLIIGDNTKSVASAKLYPVKRLNAELFYEFDSSIYSVKINDNEFKWTNDNGFFDGNEIIHLQSLFYSLVVNYSHYAYNMYDFSEEIIGRYKKNYWIESLFHKNDGYTTPIVLNPFRTLGNIDMNSETNLTKQRLFSLFLYFELNNKPFHEDYLLHSFELKLDSDNVNQKYKNIQKELTTILTNKTTSFTEVEGYILKSWNSLFPLSNKIEKKELDLCNKYLVYKTISIILKYKYIKNDYSEYIKKSKKKVDSADQFQYIISILKNDTSHVTLKLRQLISYMTLDSYKTGTLKIRDIVSKYNHWFQGHYQLNNIMDLLPPPIFNVTFNLCFRDKKNGRAKIPMTDMSSGERQLLYSLSSVLYHLINLDSVNDPTRIKYNNIQIILEEIELYFHPEYQKKFIQTLIDRISLLALDEKTKIDVLIATHSPFVLSDIPSENILFLRKGKPEVFEKSNDTFCSNFYDLLKYEFFLENNAIGIFAYNKIQMIFKYIDDPTIKLSNSELDHINKTIDLIGDTFLKGYIKTKLERRANNVSN